MTLISRRDDVVSQLHPLLSSVVPMYVLCFELSHNLTHFPIFYLMYYLFTGRRM